MTAQKLRAVAVHYTIWKVRYRGNWIMYKRTLTAVELTGGSRVQSLLNRAKSLKFDCTCSGACPASTPPRARVLRSKMSTDEHIASCSGRKCSVRVRNLVSNARNVANRAGACYGLSARAKQ